MRMEGNGTLQRLCVLATSRLSRIHSIFSLPFFALFLDEFFLVGYSHRDRSSQTSEVHLANTSLRAYKYI